MNKFTALTFDIKVDVLDIWRRACNACIAVGSECAFIKKMGEMEEPIFRVQIVLTLWMKKEEVKQSLC